jgi:hypothetical protein
LIVKDYADTFAWPEPLLASPPDQTVRREAVGSKKWVEIGESKRKFRIKE